MVDLESVFGIHSVEALLQRHPRRVKKLQYQQERGDQRLSKLLDQAHSARISTEALSKEQMDEQHEGNHQGIAAWCSPSHSLSKNELFELLDKLDHTPLLLILDNVTDPHNLGACMRSAEAAGADAVIVPKHKAAGLNATVRKVACGAAEFIPLITVTNLAQFLKQLQEKGVWLMGAAGEASQSVFEADLTPPLAIIMGAEGSGMRRLTREHCDFLVNIPMKGAVSSLNVSVATGICLFEALRQRQAGG